jgi:D-galacturonate reductase
MCSAVNAKEKTLEEIDKTGLPTLANTVLTGAILEAGRRSLDEKRVVAIVRTGKGAEGWALE